MDTATGNNLNSGSTNSSSTTYTSTSGNWDGTSVFTPTDGSNPVSSGVAVNDWCSVYPSGNTTTPYIAQVTAVTNATNGTITLSTSNKFGTAPTSNSGSRNLRDGGRWADLGMLASGVALNTGTVPVSTRINIKAGTYANTTTTRTWALTGAATTPLWVRGYKTSIGDQDSNNTPVAGTDIPNWTFTTGQIVANNNHAIYSSLAVTSASTSTGGTWSGGGTCQMYYRMQFTNTAANAAAVAFRLGGTISNAVIGCYFTSTSSANVVNAIAGTGHYFLGCIFTGGLIGLSSGVTWLVANFCVFDSQNSDAISFNGSSGNAIYNITNCSFYNPTGNGINLTTATDTFISNCYFENVNQASKAAINNTSGAATDRIRCTANTYYNCTANTSGLGDSPLVFDNGSIASQGFQNPGSQVFSLNGVAQRLAFPGPLQSFQNNANNYTGYLSNGAVEPLGPIFSGEY